MQELPVNGRNWMDLTMLARAAARIVRRRADGLGCVSAQPRRPASDQTRCAGFGQPRYSRDAIGEFEFVSNRFDASQGRSAGIQVNAITKSGTNTPGGTFSGYFRDDSSTRPTRWPARCSRTQNQQISTTFGGPIKKDRVHYFLSYEYEREPQTYVYATPVPEVQRST